MGKVYRRRVTVKVNVCPYCAALDGKIIDMDDEYDIPGIQLFEGMHQTSPVYPRCKCAVEYIEVELPKAAAVSGLYPKMKTTRCEGGYLFSHTFTVSA